MMRIEPEVNLRTIANLSGYSVSTVSKALNGSKEISKKTKIKIKDIANFYGYRPNFSAKSLKSKKTEIVGLIVPSFSNPQCAYIMEGIEEAASKKGYKLVIHKSKSNLARRKKMVKTLCDGSIDGLILITDHQATPSNEAELLHGMFRKSIPKVEFDFSEGRYTDEKLGEIKAKGEEIFADLSVLI